MSSPSMRCRTAEAPRGRRGSLSEDESEEELGGRLTNALRRGEATTGAFFGAGGLGAALPFGRPRGRFTGASGSAGASPFGGSTDGARASSAGGGGSSAGVEAITSPVSSASIGSRLIILLFDLFYATGSGVNNNSNDRWLPCRGTTSPKLSLQATSIVVRVRPPTGM